MNTTSKRVKIATLVAAKSFEEPGPNDWIKPYILSDNISISKKAAVSYLSLQEPGVEVDPELLNLTSVMQAYYETIV